MKRWVIALLLATVAALGGYAWRQHRIIDELERRVARSADEAATQRRLAAAAERVGAATPGTNAPEVAPRTTQEQPNAATAAEGIFPSGGRSSGAGLTGAEYGVDSPSVQRVMMVALRSGLDQHYGSLFRQLKLSPAEMEKLKTLLVDRQMMSLDVVRSAQAQGITSNDSPGELLALIQRAADGSDAAIRGLLGEERFQRYQHYNENASSYALLDLIERRLTYTDAPLREAQYQSLLSVVSETTEPLAGEGGPSRVGLKAYAEGFAGANPFAGVSQRLIADGTISRAQDVLSPAQAEVLVQIQAEQKNQAHWLTLLRSPPGINSSTDATRGLDASSPP